MSFFNNIANLFSPSAAPAAPAPEVPMSTITAPVTAAPAVVAAATVAAAVSTPAAPIAGLEAALLAAAPHADPAIWVPALTDALTAADILTSKRISALLGQCSVEAGNGFKNLSENTCYTTAQRLCQIFPTAFPSIASTAGYVGDAAKIANRVYANRLGNGPESSSDGSVFHGAGLLQLTGRATITTFGSTVGKSPADAAAWLRTPEGAAAGACWFWNTRGLSKFADTWSLSAVTLHVNGNAMLGNEARIAASNAALKAFGG